MLTYSNNINNRYVCSSFTMDNMNNINQILEDIVRSSDVTNDSIIDINKDTLTVLHHIFQILCLENTRHIHPYSYTFGEDTAQRPKWLISEFLPKEIKNYIFKSYSINYEYHFVVHDRTIKVHMSFFDTITALSKGKMIKMIYQWLTIATTNLRNSCSQHLTIYLYMTDFSKYLPTEKSEDIKIQHVNSAYTTSGQVKTDIIIYRKEEWFKVFVHETFHCLGLDFSHLSHTSDISNIVSNSLSSAFVFAPFDYKLYEAYCETWARIINSVFYSFYSLDNSSRTLDNFDEFCTFFFISCLL